MRDIFGAVVLIFGFFAFGFFDFTKEDVVVEAGLAAQAQAAVAGTVHDVTVAVEGREITLRGLADSRAERRAILERLRAIEGRGAIDDRLEVLPVAEPYRIELRGGAGGVVAASGHVPSEAVRARLAEVLGESAARLELSAGAPEGWAGRVLSGAGALALLTDGALVYEGAAVTLTGTALTPAERAQAQVWIDSLPDGIAATAEIGVIDDGTPLWVTVGLRDGGVPVLSGKVPEAMVLPEEVAVSDLAFSVLEPPRADWADIVAGGTAALAGLQSGQLVVTGSSVVLSGDALTRRSADAAEAWGAALPGDLRVTVDVRRLDDGAPFRLVVARDAGGAEVSGKAPVDMGPQVLDALIPGPVRLSGLDVAGIRADEMWWPTVTPVLEALALLETGQAEIDGGIVRIVGVAPDAETLARAERRLALIPSAVTVEAALRVDG